MQAKQRWDASASNAVVEGFRSLLTPARNGMQLKSLRAGRLRSKLHTTAAYVIVLYRPVREAYRIPMLLLAICAGSCCFAQSSQPEQPSNTELGKLKLKLETAGRVPAEWLIGPYVPPSEPLHPLTIQQREAVFVNQTFLTAGSYMLRMFTAGIDQARGVPEQWGGGGAGYGRRFASRYGEFMIANTFHSAGDAALGYEPRYDLCRCSGFWPRTRHAIVRNFLVYNRTERELRPAVPLYAGSFGAGMLEANWLPGRRNVWRQGAYAALGQAGWGSAYNWASEFALDILRKLTAQRYPKMQAGAATNGLPR
jgi:hypothetical protein